jgi:hypothetical protein
MRTALINNCAMVSINIPGLKKNTDGTTTAGPLVQFIPGLNLVDSEVLKILREKNPTFEKMFSTRIEKSAAPEHDPEKIGRPQLEIDKSVGKNGELPDSMPLEKLPPVQCKAMIDEMRDIAILRQWSKEETRGEVRRDIETQIEYLSGPEGAAKTAAIPGR